MFSALRVVLAPPPSREGELNADMKLAPDSDGEVEMTAVDGATFNTAALEDLPIPDYLPAAAKRARN